VVDVLTAALHPLVRSRASGRHYSSRGAVLPVVPGVDGVGRMPDGRLVFFTAFGSGGTMAQRVAVDRSASVPLPADSRIDQDPSVIAVAVNPAMSGWLAMRTRAVLRAGERVLVLGATGAAGRAAVQIAGHLGATVVAAGRNAEVLARLGADATVSLEPAPGTEPDPVAAALAEYAADVDVVVDYVWGPQTQRALAAVLNARPDPAKPLRWVQVGATAGPDITLPGAVLRSSALQLTGSGIGSIDPTTMTAELTELLAAIVAIPPTTVPESIPLADVEQAWTTEPPNGRRIVFHP
jgi:NADPH:quinone reductase-like Zn-dependent oxidoreductase